MAKGNINNLRPLNTRTKEEQKEIQRKAGIKSGEARRKKKLLREIINELLDKEVETSQGTFTQGEIISIKQLEKAMKGDTRAFEMLRDTSGQKPVEKIMTASVDADIIANVEKIIEEEINDAT